MEDPHALGAIKLRAFGRESSKTRGEFSSNTGKEGLRFIIGLLDDRYRDVLFLNDLRVTPHIRIVECWMALSQYLLL